MDLIWHGTAAMEVVCGQGKILFDPFVPLKGSPVKVSIDEFDGFSDIFVTHCHLKTQSRRHHSRHAIDG